MPDTPTSAPPALPGGFAAISKYNPHLWTPDQLRAIFVARQRELADLTQTLATLPAGEVGQHCLLVGARGMGKSTLMQRLALAVEDDAALNAAWLPLRFPEEQYTVNTLAQFWANVLDSLADALERRGLPTQAIDATAARLATLPVAEQAAATLQALREFSQAQGQRLLLLVDNTDLLLHNLGKQGHWALRQVLQSEPQLLWVGGSYQSLEANSQYHDAFLDFFRVLELRPLTLEEMQKALLALAQSFGGDSARDHLAQQLRQQPERLPTLRMLSGGNPRTTVMLYELLASGQAVHVRSALESLLDSMTPLYKARLDALADLPRKLLAHILGHWEPMSLAQLADVSQEKKTSISPQLQRLEQEGLIQKAQLHGTTRSGYQAAERFFNIWYLMRLSPRHQRTRLGWLVEFMRLWFSGDELRYLARSRIGSTQAPLTHELDFTIAVADALPENAPEKHALRWKMLKQLPQVFDFEGQDQDFKGAEDYLRRAHALPDLLHRCPHAKNEAEQQRWVDSVMGSLDWTLAQKTAVAQRCQSYTASEFNTLMQNLRNEGAEWGRVAHQDGYETIRRCVLELDFFPDMPDSALAFQQIQHCFTEHPQALRLAAIKHLDRHQDEHALQTQELAQSVFPADPNIALRRALLLHGPLKRYQEAEKAYRDLIDIDPGNPTAWNNLGNLLKDYLDRCEEAEQAYRKAITISPKFAFAWGNLGGLLQDHTDRYAEAEQAYRQAIDLNERLTFAWVGLGRLLHNHLGRHSEAESAYRKAITLDDKSAHPWNDLGNLLADRLGRQEEAEQAYRKAMALDEGQTFPVQNLARLLWRQGRQKEAQALCARVTELAVTSTDTDIDQLVLQANLMLNHQHAGLNAMDHLVHKAAQGNTLAGFQLREQVWECTDLGLGERLADWMQASLHAPFLQPMIQALYTLAGASAKLQNVPVEVQRMADAVVQDAQKHLRQMPGVRVEDWS